MFLNPHPFPQARVPSPHDGSVTRTSRPELFLAGRPILWAGLQKMGVTIRDALSKWPDNPATFWLDREERYLYRQSNRTTP